MGIRKKTVLFQGDSITDAGRNRQEWYHMGDGYARMIETLFRVEEPQSKVKFINRGVSGDRVVDLAARWQEDCLDIKPDILSIMIGINDCWRRYDSNEETSVDEFEKNYRKLLTQVESKLETKVVLLEPFVLPYPKDREDWREDLDPKIQIVRKLAREYNTELITLDGCFAKASIYREPKFWAEDGVHPSMAGHALIAKEWLKVMKSYLIES